MRPPPLPLPHSPQPLPFNRKHKNRMHVGKQQDEKKKEKQRKNWYTFSIYRLNLLELVYSAVAARCLCARERLVFGEAAGRKEDYVRFWLQFGFFPIAIWYIYISCRFELDRLICYFYWTNWVEPFKWSSRRVCDERKWNCSLTHRPVSRWYWIIDV